MPSYIGAIDQGTTSTRFIVFDKSGRIVSVAQKEHQQIYLKPGWVEHDPEEIWRRTREVIAEAMQRRDLGPSDLAAIGITNQRETTLVWDRRTGKPVCNAIVWQDRRGAPLCTQLAEMGAEAEVRSRTGLLIDPYFSATKIAWILDNVTGAREQAERGHLAFGTVDSWLIWRLTNRRSHVTDATN